MADYPTRSLAKLEHDVQRRMAAKKGLKYPAVSFTGVQARAIGRGFGKYVERAGLQVWACAILPEHVHMVIGRFRLDIEQIVIQLKGDATQQLLDEEIHPLGHFCNKNGRRPRRWARGEWSVFLETFEDIQRAIVYVEENPAKEGKRTQRWSFVTPFDPATIV